MVLKYLITKFFAKKKYRNLLESLYWNAFIRKIIGLTVMDFRSVAGSFETSLSTLGLCGYLIYTSAFTYSVYVAYSEDQTILRLLFDTKLKQYGDLFEKVASVMFTAYMMNNCAFYLSPDFRFMKMNVEVDTLIKNMGVTYDYNNHAVASVYMALAQEFLHIFRVICICGILYGQIELKNIPLAKIFVGAYSDAVALCASSAYCYYLFIWKEKYSTLNKILREIKERKLWEQTLFANLKGINASTASYIEDEYICEKIKKCANLNTKLYAGIEHINSRFGVTLAVVIFFSSNYIILYMFYFMEATASGMFHDVQRYLRLLVFIFWQIGYCVFVLGVMVYFTEDILKEMKKTSGIIHEIIHCDFSARVKTEAMQFSIQLLQEVPIFTTHGMYIIDYSLLHDGSRYILQFLVMLLQFVQTK